MVHTGIQFGCFLTKLKRHDVAVMLLDILLKGVENSCPHYNSHTGIYSSFIHIPKLGSNHDVFWKVTG
jgi:hypothetical protein